MVWTPAGRAPAIVVFLAGLGVAGSVAANERPPMPGGSQECPDWCGSNHAWETAASGAGPETSSATVLGLGVAGETLRLGDGRGRTETAALFGFEFRFPLYLSDSNRGFDERVMRLRVMGQQLGWRVGDDLGVAEADLGGSVALGYTESLHWFSYRSKLAATVDVEGATGLGVRGGLGLRTTDVSARAVGAAGLALGLDGRAGGLRAHARVLHALTADAGWDYAAEVGVGVATRFDWPGLDGPWPIEAWIDVRERRGLGASEAARERELTTGLSYVPAKGFARIGVVGTATDERLADGVTGRGRTLMVRF
jgi:hypothetical protein